MAEEITVNREILEQAIAAVKIEIGLHLRIDKTEAKLNNYRVDAVLHIEGAKNTVAAEVKNWAQHANLGVLVNQIKNLPEKGLLVADYVNPKMAEKLRREDVQFIDTVGNAYINMPPIYVYATANRNDTAKLKPTKIGAKRAFEPTGLKVIFAFLCQPELVNAPYRDIAEQAGVALGTVGWVLNGLKAAGFIRDKGKKQGRRLVNYQKLLARWVEVYPEKLKPKQLLGDFIADDPYWWKNIKIQNYNGYWGGEIAAAKYTEYLKPQIATVYLHNEMLTKFLTEARLHKATQWQEKQAGKVEIYQVFWTDTKIELVHPILAYADLVATGDTRNIETARRIYDKYITRYFRED